MQRKLFFAVRLTAKQLAGLRRIQNKVGISAAEQVRRAIDAWLKKQARRKSR